MAEASAPGRGWYTMFQGCAFGAMAERSRGTWHSKSETAGLADSPRRRPMGERSRSSAGRLLEASNRGCERLCGLRSVASAERSP